MLNDIELVPVWSGDRGWHDQDCAKGQLLPEYNSATTLTEATQELASRRNCGDFGDDRKRRAAVGPRRFAEMRHLRWDCGWTLGQIAKKFHLTIGAVYPLVR